MSLSRAVTPLAKPVKWEVAVPGSKSYMNRAVVCAALAKGKSVLQNPVYCDDTNYLLKALQLLGVRFVKKPGRLIVYGTGGQFHKPLKALNVGNAGTAMRFLLPHLPAGTTITGNKRMQQRPIADLVAALNDIGLAVECATGCPPVTIHARSIQRRTVHIPGNVSSQFISSLLLLAPTLPQGLRIIVPGALVSAPYVSMTLATMQSFGVYVKKIGDATFDIQHQPYQPKQYTIEGDVSAATYWWALAAISRSRITVTNVTTQTLQPDIQCLDILRRMGCVVSGTTVTGPWGGPEQLRGVRVNMQTCPDAVMSIAVIAALAKGTTIISGVTHLAHKETNRLQALRFNLRILGISARATTTALHIKGRTQTLWSDTIMSYDDHRLAMAFTILGLVQPGLKITQPECVRKSYPNFWQDVRAVQTQARQQSIVLTGMRGVGKTTLGKKLAQKYHCHFIDIDQEITKRVGQPIAKYVFEHSWSNFRQLEHEVFKKVVQQKNVVIATGGGTLMYSRNVRLLSGHYVILFIAPLALLQRRLLKDNTRPTLRKTSRSAAAELKTIWQERQTKYLTVADNIFNIV